MKNKKTIIISLLLVATGLFSFTYVYQYYQLTSSDHDFSAETWNSSGDKCVVCHTENGIEAGDLLDVPLWNHETTTETFQLYTSGSINFTPEQPNGNSLLCMSCHDGHVPYENFGGATGGSHYMTSGMSAYIGTDLRNEHPVSFVYDAALVALNSDLADPTTALSGVTANGTIAEDMLDGNSKLQCTSCHEPHNNAGLNYMLIKSNAASALCITCHIK